MGHDSSVGIVNRYGLDGPGIEYRWRRDFLQPSRPALGPAQTPVRCVRGPFTGRKVAGAWCLSSTPTSRAEGKDRV